MPFEGPQGQGPFEDFEACVEAMEDEDGVEDPEALCAAWENQANAMSESSNDVQHRQHYQPDPDDVRVDDDLSTDEDAGLMRIRMPVASTGEVRNEGDDPLSGEELRGMADQLASEQIGIFPNHGYDSMISQDVFSPFEKLGYWDDASIEERDGNADLLVADAVMPDPEDVTEVAGEWRQGLAILKEQAKRGIALSSSIGWRDDEDAPGGVDLIEASIVGIPADPRTDSSQTASQTGLLARAAIDAGADPEELVDAVRAAVMGARDEQRQDVETVQTPEYDSTAEGSGRWDGHDLEDFSEVVEDPSPQDPEVYEKFIFSETGFPPAEDADYDTLNLEVVDVDGTLRLDALDDAWQTRGQVEPTNEDEEAEIEAVLIDLIGGEFPDSELAEQLGEAEGDEDSNSAQSMTDRDLSDVAETDLADLVTAFYPDADTADVTGALNSIDGDFATDGEIYPEIASFVALAAETDAGPSDVMDLIASDSQQMASTDDESAGEKQSADADDSTDRQDDAPEWAQRVLDLLEDIHGAVRQDDEEDQPEGDEGDEGDDEEDDDEEEEDRDADDDEEEEDRDADDDEEEEDRDADDDVLDEIRKLRAELSDAEPATPGDDGDEEHRKTTDDDSDGPNWRA